MGLRRRKKVLDRVGRRESILIGECRVVLRRIESVARRRVSGVVREERKSGSRRGYQAK